MARIRYMNEPDYYVGDRNTERKVTAKLAVNFEINEAIAEAKRMLARGENVAVFDAGQQVQFEQVVKAPVNENIVYKNLDGTDILWRIEPKKLPNGKYGINFHDTETDMSHFPDADTPQLLFEKIRDLSFHPVYARLINQLPTVEPAAPAVVAAPVDNGPKKFLRPGDRQDEPSSPRREIQSSSTAGYALDYEAWMSNPNTSVADIKARLRTDPNFVKFCERDAQFINKK